LTVAVVSKSLNERALRGELELLDHRRHRDEALMNGKIGTLRMLDEPLVGVGIAPENELESLPLQAEADGAIQRVDRRPGSDRDPVLLVDDLVHGRVVELRGFDVVTTLVGDALTAVEIPGHHLLEVIHCVLGASFGRIPARPPDTQRLLASGQRTPDEQ
jgi:hypothetical protein